MDFTKIRCRWIGVISKINWISVNLFFFCFFLCCCGLSVVLVLSFYKWATSWQNQQSDCAQQRLRSARASAQSDQRLCCALSGQLRTQAFYMRTVKTPIRLGGCPGWSESSLGAQSFCWFCHVAAQMLRQHTKQVFMFLRCLRQVVTVFIDIVISYGLSKQLAIE